MENQFFVDNQLIRIHLLIGVSRSLFHAHTLSLLNTHAHSLSRTHSLSHTHSLAHTLSLKDTHTLSLSLSLSHTLTHGRWSQSRRWGESIARRARHSCSESKPRTSLSSGASLCSKFLRPVIHSWPVGCTSCIVKSVRSRRSFSPRPLWTP